jgi:predicted unusual protein kinase regulating ubiquinone biosynthesis (AarF/ABC1/UbiB family)
MINLRGLTMFLQTLFILCSETMMLKLGFITNNEYFINVTTKLSKINMFYIKIFQWFSHAQSIDSSVKEYFCRFADNVGFSREEIDYEALFKLYIISQERNEIFQIDSLNPISSGTIALVFKGRLNNRPVVIKIMRKNIKQNIDDAISLFNYLIGIVSWLPLGIPINFNDVIDCQKIKIIEQSDFLNEVKNIETYQSHFKKSKIVRIPKVYKDYTERINNLIVMEYLEGRKLIDLPKEEKPEYLSVLAKININGYFKYGLFHGDTHPGNVIFMKDPDDSNNEVYKIGLIDYGTIGTLTIDEQSFIYKFLIQYVDYNVDGYLSVLIDFIKGTNHQLKKEDFINELHKLKNNGIMLKNNELSHYDFFIIINLARKYKITVQKGIHTLFLAVISGLNLIDNLADKENNKTLKVMFKKAFDELLPKKLCL